MNAKIYTALDEGYNEEFRYKGTYLHGILQEEYGYDIFSFDKDYSFFIGIHSVVLNNEQPCLFFLWEGNITSVKEKWRGLLVDATDVKSIQYAFRKYTDRSGIL